MNSLSLSDAKLNALLDIAGKKLGQDPQTLKSQLQGGQLDGIINKMNPTAQKQMAGMLNDPKKLEALMADDKVKGLLSQFMK